MVWIHQEDEKMKPFPFFCLFLHIGLCIASAILVTYTAFGWLFSEGDIILTTVAGCIFTSYILIRPTLKKGYISQQKISI